MSPADCATIVALPKAATPPLVWVDRVNHAGRRVCTSVLTDLQGITIPGLTMLLEAQAPIVVPACLYLFALFKLVHGRPTRIYQLEVCPQGKRSHNGLAGVLYGPHEHVGDDVNVVNDPLVTCDDWQTSYAWFLNRCNLQALTISTP